MPTLHISNPSLFWLAAYSGSIVFFGALLFSIYLFSGGLSPLRLNRRNLFKICLYSLLFIAAASVLYRAPYGASDLEVSDSVEYAVAADRLVTLQQYNLVVDGQTLPPRYPPFFSAFLLSPAINLFGPDIGASIWPVFLSSILAILMASLVGGSLSGVWGSIATVGLLLLVPEFRHLSRLVMTDLPTVACYLAGALLYLLWQRKGRHENLIFLVVGLLVGFIALLRPTNAILLIPFLLLTFRSYSWADRIKEWMLLGLPLLGAAWLQGAYNNLIFGTPWRSGYHFWVAVPYEYYWLTFSTKYILPNFFEVISQGSCFVLLVFLAGLPMLRQLLQGKQLRLRLRDQTLNPFLKFTLLIGIGHLLVYLPYVYCSTRFFVPLATLLAIAVGGVLGGFLRTIKTPYKYCLPGLIVFTLLSVGLKPEVMARNPSERAVADILANQTPNNALIISGLNPVYVEPLVLRGTQRHIIPVSRRIEFASKVILPKTVLHSFSPPRDWRDYWAEGVMRSGARQAVSWVGIESMDKISELLRSGRPVFLETAFLTKSEKKDFDDKFLTEAVAPDLLKLSFR